MNTYQENLLTTVNTTLAELSAEQERLASAQNCAELSLYYAQGAQISATEKLSQSTAEYEKVKVINQQSVNNDNLAGNLLNSSTESDANVKTAVTNTATMASNIQIATNAIAKLAANIGSAFNIVSATNNGSDIDQLTKHANNLIHQTAYSAEMASQTALEASSAAAEISSTQVLTDTTVTQSKVADLLATTQGSFAQISEKKANDNTTLAAAQKNAETVSGTLADASCELNAINTAYNSCNTSLNYGLSIANVHANYINVHFNEFIPPFSQTSESSNLDQITAEILPEANPVYYIFLVKRQHQDLFDLDKAGELVAHPNGFADATGSLNHSTHRHTVKLHFCPYTQADNGLLENTKVQVMTVNNEIQVIDSDGDPIQSGQEYAAFLYIELSKAYKRFINNFSDLLSAPSSNFTPMVNLPKVKSFTSSPNSADNTVDLKFAVEQARINNGIFTPNIDGLAMPFSDIEYRCIFVPVSSSTDSTVPPVTDFTSLKFTDFDQAALKFNFSLMIADKVTAANYSILDPSTLQITVDDSTTDNFGKLLNNEFVYAPVIVATVPGSYPNHFQYETELFTPGPAKQAATPDDEVENEDEPPAPKKTSRRRNSK